jgi:hypothetical protein
LTTEDFDAACNKWCAGQDYGHGPEAGKPHPFADRFLDVEHIESLTRYARKFCPEARVAQASGNPRKFMIMSSPRPGFVSPHAAIMVRGGLSEPLLTLFRETRRAAKELSDLGA